MAPVERQGIERHLRHCFARRERAERQSAKIIRCAIIERRHQDIARLAADAGLMREDVRRRIQHDVGAENLMDDALRLEGDDTTATTHRLGEIDRVRAHVGAEIEHGHARLDDLREERGFGFGKLAVEIERAADIAICRKVEHHAVTAAFSAQRRPVEDQPVIHNRLWRGVHRRRLPPVAFSTAATSLAEKPSISASVRVASAGCKVTLIASDFLSSGKPLP